MEAASRKRGDSRRRISGDERRESILQLTSRAFAERGYDGVRTAELAESAGVSEALIYQHFRTKAELYHAAVDRSADIFEQRMGEAVRDGAPVEQRLRSGIDAFFSFVAEPDNSWTVLTLNVSDPELADYQRELRKRAIGALADLLAVDPRAAGSSPIAATWSSSPRSSLEAPKRWPTGGPGTPPPSAANWSTS
jgi:AcrR family transcriptional regulator